MCPYSDLDCCMPRRPWATAPSFLPAPAMALQDPAASSLARSAALASQTRHGPLFSHACEDYALPGLGEATCSGDRHAQVKAERAQGLRPTQFALGASLGLVVNGRGAPEIDDASTRANWAVLVPCQEEERKTFSRTTPRAETPPLDRPTQKCPAQTAEAELSYSVVKMYSAGFMTSAGTPCVPF